MKQPKRRPSRRSAKSRSQTKSRAKIPRTAEQYHAKPERFRNIWDKVISVVSKMRGERISLKKASEESGVSPSTVKRWAGAALQKRTSGKWSAKQTDNLLRVMLIPTTEGTREIAVRGSRGASLLGEFWSSVQRFLETGDRSRLDKFRDKFITDANGTRIPLLTERGELRRLGSAGVLSFESIYARSL